MIGWLAVVAMVAIAVVGPAAQPSLANGGDPLERLGRINRLGELCPSALRPQSEAPICDPDGIAVLVLKGIDADGDVDTIYDQELGGSGWSFEFAVDPGEIVDSFATTDPSGFAGFAAEFDGDTTSVSVEEPAVDGYALLDVECYDADSLNLEVTEVGGPIGTRTERGISFDATNGGFYVCVFLNTPTGAGASGSPAVPPSDNPGSSPSGQPPQNEVLVFVVKLIDEDGDPATWGDQVEAPGWAFSYDSEDGSVSGAETVTDAYGEAWFWVGFGGETATVSITETSQEGYELIDAVCYPMFYQPLRTETRRLQSTSTVPAVLDGTTLTFDVEADGAYDCYFVNAAVASEPSANPTGEVGAATASPRITLPPTDLGSAPAGPTSGAWRAALIPLAVLLAGVLVITPARPRSRR